MNYFPGNTENYHAKGPHYNDRRPNFYPNCQILCRPPGGSPWVLHGTLFHRFQHVPTPLHPTTTALISTSISSISTRFKSNHFPIDFNMLQSTPTCFNRNYLPIGISFDLSCTFLSNTPSPSEHLSLDFNMCQSKSPSDRDSQ